MFGNKVLFLFILLTANLKASSSALTRETGPSVCSNIPPKTQSRRHTHETVRTWMWSQRRKWQFWIGFNGEKNTDGHLLLRLEARQHYAFHKVLHLFSKHAATLSIFREYWSKRGKKNNISFEVWSHNGFKECASLCVFMLVCLYNCDSRMSQALVSPLRYPFISPAHRCGRADNWTQPLFFYLKFKGKYSFIFQIA